MKNKIRRAFDLTKPDVLSRVQPENPAPAPITKKKAKKRLSDRAVQFIATAASISIFIGAVSGGIHHYRDYFTLRQDPTTGTESHFPEIPGLNYTPLVPGTTDPLPTVDYDWSEEGLIQRTAQIINGGDVELDYYDSLYPGSVQATITQENGVYTVTRDCNAIRYTFEFNDQNGALLRITAENVSRPLTSFTGHVTANAAAWIALMDLDPAHFGLTQFAQYSVDSPTYDRYRVEIQHNGTSVYYIDCQTGEILDLTEPGGEMLSADAAMEIAEKNALNKYGSCYPVDCRQTDSSDYIVTLCRMDAAYGGLVGMEYTVDAYSGQILRITEGSQEGTEDDALRLATAYADRLYGDHTIAYDQYIFSSGLPSRWAFTVTTAAGGTVEIHVIDLPQVVWLAPAQVVNIVDLAERDNIPTGEALDWFYADGLYDYYYISVKSQYVIVEYSDGSEKTAADALACGDIGIPDLDAFGISYYKQAIPSDIVNARDVALEQYGYTIEDVRILKISESAGYFEITYECGGNGHSLQVDADGNVLHDYGTMEAVCPELPAESIGWKSARNLCLADCGRSIYELIGFSWDIGDGCFWMELHFSDSSYSYQVDAMDGTLIFDYPVVDGTITYAQAWEIAVRSADCLDEALAGTLTNISNDLDESGGAFVIRFWNGSVCWEIKINAYTGEVLQALSSGLTPPDGRITEEGAILHAVEYIGCKEAYLAGTLEVDVKCDEENRCYYVYFTWAEIYWEIQVAFFNGGDVLSANSSTVAISEEEAIQAAMEHAACMEDYLAGAVEDLVCTLGPVSGSDGSKYEYHVSFRIVNQDYFEVSVDALDGSPRWITSWAIGTEPPRADYENVSSCVLGSEPQRSINLNVASKPGIRHYYMTNPSTGGWIPLSTSEGAVDTTEAMNILAKQVGLDTFTSGSVAMHGCFSDGEDFYCVVIPMEGYSHVALMDPDTGAILCQLTIE